MIKIIENIDILFPLELSLSIFTLVTGFFMGGWILSISILPIIFYNIQIYKKGEYKIYYEVGEYKKNSQNFATHSLTYKFKFVNYMILTIISFLSFILGLITYIADVYLHDSEFVRHIFKFLGLY